MDDLISRQAAIDEISEYGSGNSVHMSVGELKRRIEYLPSAQPEQTDMIKEIREWINSGNRGISDYFIVDKIEEIINKYGRFNQQTGGD